MENTQNRKKRSTLGLKKGKTFAEERKAVGHEATLRDYRARDVKITVGLMSGVTVKTCQVVTWDKFTITIKDNKGQVITLFKHAIEGFSPDVSQ